MLQTGFPSIVDEFSSVLVLGSMPGVASLKRREYYAHERNTFWPIMAAIAAVDLPASYGDKVALLKEQKIALWDVIGHCERPGSLDSAIVEASICVNDFERFFSAYPRIRRVLFNGKKASDIFRRHLKRHGPFTTRDIDYLSLPSTSPANAGMRFEAKLALWREALRVRE